MKELKNNFEIAQTTHAEKLQALRMRDQDLAKFNEQFAKLAIGAKQMLTEYSINQHYVSALRPVILADWLQGWRHLPLPQLQAKALQMESSAVAASSRSRGGQNANGGQPRVQDPNRIKCPKCNWWHRKDEPCRPNFNSRN